MNNNQFRRIEKELLSVSVFLGNPLQFASVMKGYNPPAEVYHNFIFSLSFFTVLKATETIFSDQKPDRYTYSM